MAVVCILNSLTVGRCLAGVVWQGVINRVFESLSIGKVAPLMCAQMKVVTLGIIVWLELRGCFF